MCQEPSNLQQWLEHSSCMCTCACFVRPLVQRTCSRNTPIPCWQRVPSFVPLSLTFRRTIQMIQPQRSDSSKSIHIMIDICFKSPVYVPGFFKFPLKKFHPIASTKCRPTSATMYASMLQGRGDAEQRSPDPGCRVQQAGGACCKR